MLCSYGGEAVLGAGHTNCALLTNKVLEDCRSEGSRHVQLSSAGRDHGCLLPVPALQDLSIINKINFFINNQIMNQSLSKKKYICQSPHVKWMDRKAEAPAGIRLITAPICSQTRGAG